MDFLGVVQLLTLISLVISIVALIIQTIVRRRAAAPDKATKEITARNLVKKMLQVAGLTKRVTTMRGDSWPYTFYSSLASCLTLDPEEYDSSKPSSLAPVLFEIGHAFKEAAGSRLIVVREILMKVFAWTRFFVWPLVLLGKIADWTWMESTGAIVIVIMVLSSLALLPTERNCARRALRVAERKQILSKPLIERVRPLVEASTWDMLVLPIGVIVSLCRLLTRFCVESGKQAVSDDSYQLEDGSDDDTDQENN